METNKQREAAFPFKVGDKIRQDCFDGGLYVKILYIGEHTFLSRYNDGREYLWRLGTEKWELYSEPERPKKPSERILELIGPTRSDPEWQEKFFDMVLVYLDEQFDKGALK